MSRPSLRGGNEIDAGLFHARVNARVFLLALLDVPARQAVFDLSVRPFVLLDHGDADSVVRQNFRRDRTGNRTADHRDKV